MKTTTEKPKAEGDCSPASCSAEVFVRVFESLDYDQLAMIAAQAIHRMTDRLKKDVDNNQK